MIPEVLKVNGVGCTHSITGKTKDKIMQRMLRIVDILHGKNKDYLNICEELYNSIIY